MPIFKNHDKLTFELAYAIGEATGSKWSVSNKSCSVYVRKGEKELRISDHGDFHDWTGERQTLRFEHLIETVYYEMDFETGDSAIVREADYEGEDRDADYAGLSIDQSDFDALVKEAVEFLA